MNTSDYIINELKIFIKRFSKVRVRYEYDENTQTHVIEVVPNEVYHLSEDYISWESEMFDKFVTLYPTENICFISDDALVGIDNEMFIKEGLDYAPISTDKSRINGTAVIFPYIREHMDISLKAGIDATIMQPANFAKIERK